MWLHELELYDSEEGISWNCEFNSETEITWEQELKLYIDISIEFSELLVKEAALDILGVFDGSKLSVIDVDRTEVDTDIIETPDPISEDNSSTLELRSSWIEAMWLQELKLFDNVDDCPITITGSLEFSDTVWLHELTLCDLDESMR